MEEENFVAQPTSRNDYALCHAMQLIYRDYNQGKEARQIEPNSKP